MPSKVFRGASQISSNYQCENCGIMLDQAEWTRCIHCKLFHLCKVCDKIPYQDLHNTTLEQHREWHSDTEITVDLLQPIFFADVNRDEDKSRWETTEQRYRRTVNQQTIENDHEMPIITQTLSSNRNPMNDRAAFVVPENHLTAQERKVNILSLDGGGVRGYMPMKILTELITQKYLPNMTVIQVKDANHKAQFNEAQQKFSQNFDCFVGTSIGGLIAFCLAIGYNILDLMEIFSDAKHYFKRNRLGPWLSSKYDPSVIHKKIDHIINATVFPGNKRILAEHATLLDLRNLLNPGCPITAEEASSKTHQCNYRLKFADHADPRSQNKVRGLPDGLQQVQREKVLLITAFNTTTNSIMVFNTSYSEHWGYRIADVLKSTMATPTFFPPHQVFKWTQKNGQFRRGGKSELFIDGVVFANDPELIALSICRKQFKKPADYHILSIGTGTNTLSSSPKTSRGCLGWILNTGFLVNTLMDAARNFSETLCANLTNYNDIRRMKLNYDIVEAIDLDNPRFASVFNEEWKCLKNEADFKAFLYVHETQFMEKI